MAAGSRIDRAGIIAKIEAARERKRRQKAARPPYTPNSGQLEVHSCGALNRFVFSGNGAGKTALAINEVVWAVQGYNPILKVYTRVPAKVVVVLDAPAKVADIWLPELRKWADITKWELHKDGKPSISRVILPNGSEIRFMFHLQEELAFEGIEAQGLIIYDEPPPRHIFIALKRASRTKGHKTRHLLIGTPISAPWLRTDIYDPWSRGELPDTECFRFGTTVNAANLAPGYLEEFSRHMTEAERKIRLEGAFFDLAGLALAHLFKRDRHVIPPFKWTERMPVVVAIDPAGAKPHVACMLGVNENDELFYIKELSLKAPAAEFAKVLREWYRPFPVIDIVCDSLGSSEQSGGDGLKSFIQVLNENGVRARATRYDEKKDEEWIAGIQEALLLPADPKGAPKLRIFEGNPLIIQNIENVQWLKYRNEDIFKPKLDISQLDALAALKYALAARPHFGNFRNRTIGASSLGRVNPLHRTR